MVRRAFWMSGLSLVVVGSAIAALTVGAPDAGAQTSPTKNMHMKQAGNNEVLQSGPISRVTLLYGNNASNRYYMVQLTGNQMLCTIHTSTIEEAAAIRDSISNDDTRDVFCTGEKLSAATYDIRVYLVPNGAVNHRLEVRGGT